MRVRFVLLCLVLLLSACQTSADLRRDSPYFTGFIGSHLRLKQTLEFKPNKVSVYMQWGKVVEFVLVDAYQPSCKFEINTMQEQFRSVSPDTFKIIRLRRDEEYVQARPYKVASLKKALFSYDAMAVIYSTELYLHSDKQPDVRVITCSHWENPLDASHLTVNQIQIAMGEIFTLQTIDE